MNKNNPKSLICDPETGTCEMPFAIAHDNEVQIISDKKPLKIIYYTDPICSSCWGIEPQLRKLKLEYGEYIEIDYRMGGLLPDWSYNSGGISKPSDVAHHWDEVSLHYQMPIDGDVWLEDPLDSSYPPCIAVKAAQMQDKDKAVVFMRILREYLFLDKKNITKWENIALAAEKSGLDIIKFKNDYEGSAIKLFEKDLLYARELGVRGFPTLFFSNGTANQLTVYGSKPYEYFEQALLTLLPEAEKNIIEVSSPLELFEHYPTLTIREYSEILEIPSEKGKEILEKFYKEGSLSKKTIKTGDLYLIK